MVFTSNLRLLILLCTATSSLARSIAIPRVPLVPEDQYSLEIINTDRSGQTPIMPERPSIPPPRTVTGSKHPFDAEENSVGVLFTTLDPSAPDVVHLWLPLDKIVSTRDSPFLPLHPLTARITTFIHTRPELAAPELLDRIQCDVWTYSNRTETTSRTERWKVSFSKKDGLVRFADERGPFWLGGKEVESYYCFS